MEANKLDKSIELIDIKNLNTIEIKQVKEWCEQELEFRNAIGQEINREQEDFLMSQKETTERLKAIRTYIDNGIELNEFPGMVEGSFEHMVNQDHLVNPKGFAGEYEEGDDWADKK